MAALLPYEDALAAALGLCVPVAAERIPLATAHGRILAAVPEATAPLPPFPNSAMDGFAVRVADVGSGGATLPLDPPVPAGTAPPPLRPGHAAPIATGGQVPAGADAIVPIEDADTDGAVVRLPGALVAGRHIRAAGSDLPAGPLPLRTGQVLDAAAGAVLAAAGAVAIDVYRRPRVTILSTGSELVPPERTPGPAQIRDANSTALAWAHARAGGEVRMAGIAVDDAAALRPLLADALDADVVVTSAGVSVGERDLVRGLLAELGVEPVYWGVDLKPGKPIAVGVRGDTPVISLPGNPASALVCSALIAEPVTRARAGAADPRPREEHARAAGDWPPREGRMHAVRCRLEPGADGGATVIPTGDQRSHRIGSMLGASALALLPGGVVPRAGEVVRILRLD